MTDRHVLASRVPRLRLRDGYDTTFEISRDAKGAFSRVSVRLALQYVDLPVEALASMAPGSVTELRVEAARKLSAANLGTVTSACERLNPGVLTLPQA